MLSHQKSRLITLVRRAKDEEDDTDDAKEPAKPLGVEENDEDIGAIDVSNSKKIQVNNLVRR